MADESQPDTTETPAKGDTDADRPDGLGDAGKKALDAERKARREAEASLKQLEAKLADIEDADKTELQKALDRATKAESDAAKASARADRYQVALSKGLTATQAKRLVGDTVEELEADADDLVADFTPDVKTPGSSKPKTNLQSGNDPDSDDDEVDADSLADRIMGSTRF